jgi:hypothetical protein
VLQVEVWRGPERRFFQTFPVPRREHQLAQITFEESALILAQIGKGLIDAGVLRAPAQPPNARPVGIGVDEGGVPLESGLAAVRARHKRQYGHGLLFSVVHSVAMIAAGGFLAWLVYRYLGLTFVSRSWFNLDATWAFSLVLVGALSLAINLASRH